MVRLVYVLFLCMLPASGIAAWMRADVAHVIDGASFVTTGGDTVRLAGIEAPAIVQGATPSMASRPGEPLGEEAKKTLGALLEGRKIRIETIPGLRDRHNRLVAQVYREDNAWVQGAMLGAGLAMVTSFVSDDPQAVGKMLHLEAVARTSRRGIWAQPYFRVIAPEETGNFLSRYKLVEGKVVSVNLYHGNLYINFSERWKGRFAVFISRKFLPSFTLPDVLALPGKTILVRGWIDYHNAPMINAEQPQQIEVAASHP